MAVNGAERSIVRSDIDVKSWVAKEPTVEAARPGRCPRCGGAGRPTGGPLGLHGHGLRGRQVRGPLEPGGRPLLLVLRVRRYRCQACAAVLTVVPRELTTGYLFSRSAVGWALALFGVMALPPREVRRQTSPWSRVGASAVTGWMSLRRWIDGVRAGRLLPGLLRPPPSWTSRRASSQLALVIAAHAGPTVAALPVAAQAFVGAAQVRWR
jgi:hypothetical protein